MLCVLWFLSSVQLGHNKWEWMDNYFILFFSQYNSQNWNEVNLFLQFRYSVLPNLFLCSSFRQIGLGSNFKLTNKPRPLYSVIAWGLWVFLVKLKHLKTARSLHIFGKDSHVSNVSNTNIKFLESLGCQVYFIPSIRIIHYNKGNWNPCQWKKLEILFYTYCAFIYNSSTFTVHHNTNWIVSNSFLIHTMILVFSKLPKLALLAF